ncbi:MAG: hypothetical protein ABUL62_04150 [Myxococcales bacterium]
MPAAALLLIWFRAGALRWREDVLPTIPFFSVALVLGAVTAWLEKMHVGAQGVEYALTFSQRGLIAGHAFWFYLGKLLWPAHLCFVYPRRRPEAAAVGQWLYPIAALGLLFMLWRKRALLGRGPVTALLFFAGLWLRCSGSQMSISCATRSSATTGLTCRASGPLRCYRRG